MKSILHKIYTTFANMKSKLLEEDINHISPIEETGIILYINGAVISIVSSIIVTVFLTIPFKMIPKNISIYIQLLSIIWTIISIIALILAEKYIRERKSKNIRNLLCITAISLLTANGFLLSGILMGIGVYFIYESHMRKK